MKKVIAICSACMLVLQGCIKSDIGPVSGRPDTLTNLETISARLSPIMSDLKSAEKIFLDAQDPNSDYIIADPNLAFTSLEWLSYSLIENIDSLSGSISNKMFRKSEEDASIELKLVADQPTVSWSLEKGSNQSAEVSKFTSMFTKSDSYIYEITISKIAEFTVKRNAFDSEKFNEYVFASYVLSDSTGRNYSRFNKFKKSYGVARGGVLYDIVINEFKSTKLDGESDIAGIVKAKGQFYKKSGQTARHSVLKAFYTPPALEDPSTFYTLYDNLKPKLDDVQDPVRFLDSYQNSTILTPQEKNIVLEIERESRSFGIR